MAQTRRIAGLDAQFTQDETGNLYEDGVLVAPHGKWDMDEGNNLTVNGEGYGPNARADALREQGYMPVPSIGGLDPSQLPWDQLDQQLGLTPVIGPSGDRWLSPEDRNKVNAWGYEQGILKDQGGFGDFALEAIKHVGPVMMGAPALLGPAGATTMFSEIAGNLFGGGVGAGASTAAPAATGALANAPAAVEATGALSGGASTLPGYGTFDPFTAGVANSGLPAATGASTVAGSTLGTAAPFTAGLASVTSPAAASALSTWEAGALPAATTGMGGAPSAPSTPAPEPTYPPLDGEGGMTPTTYGEAGGTMTPLEVSLRSLLGGLPAGLQQLLGGGTGGIDWGKLLAGGAGVVGSMYATDKYDQLARDAMDMMGGDTLKNARKNALTRYETNAASPSAFLEDPWVQSALDQATKARTRALSKTTPVVGNPGAETDIQKTAISSLFGNLMLPYRQQLASEAGIASGPAQAAQLATSIGGKAIDTSMKGWDAAGYGASGLSGGSGSSGSSGNILDLIKGFSNLSGAIGV